MLKEKEKKKKENKRNGKEEKEREWKWARAGITERKTEERGIKEMSFFTSENFLWVHVCVHVCCICVCVSI